MSSFYDERPIKAIRKARRCDGCGAMIEVGVSAVGCAGHYDGQFWAATYHRDCRKAEIALNDLHDIYPDEWMNIGADMEWEDWPWLIETFPSVAARMKITSERFAEVQGRHRRCRAAFLKPSKVEA